MIDDTETVALNKPATTTLAQDKTRANQRKVNMIWEVTQAGVAMIITLAVVYCSIEKIASEELKNSFFLIIGFYFSRTNHPSTGGVIDKQEQTYEGR